MILLSKIKWEARSIKCGVSDYIFLGSFPNSNFFEINFPMAEEKNYYYIYVIRIFAIATSAILGCINNLSNSKKKTCCAYCYNK